MLHHSVVVGTDTSISIYSLVRRTKFSNLSRFHSLGPLLVYFRFVLRNLNKAIVTIRFRHEQVSLFCFTVVSTLSGEWDTLAVTFRFGRNTLYFIIQMYIPSTLIVMVSWVSFWVGRASVPARAALGITTVLTLLTLISSTNANMPKISYMKAIDVYFAGCFLFVFASLIEFAAVCYLDRSRHNGHTSQRKRPPLLYHANTNGNPIKPINTLVSVCQFCMVFLDLKSLRVVSILGKSFQQIS